MSTYEILSYAAKTWPDRPALIDVEGGLSYAELFAQTEVLKQCLLKAGIKPGMGLGIMGKNSRAFIAAMFAGMGCGAIVLPLAHKLTQAEIVHIIDDTGLHAILDDLAGIKPLAGNTESIAFKQQVLRFSWTHAPLHKPITNLLDAAFIRYTSGTTGTRKGVLLTHQRILERVQVTQQALKLTPDDAVLWVLPMAFHFLVTILVYIRSGVRIIVCKDLLAQTLINDANRYHATLLYASPVHYRLLAVDPSEQHMPTLKYAISTSSSIPITVANAFKQRFKLPITQAYGIIEAGLPLLDQFSAQADSESVGYPIADFEVALLNEDNVQVKQGETGRLAIRGPGMFNAYLRPWQTAQELMNNGWFMTGDLAKCNTDGKIVVCGREKAMINVSGNKAFPEEIEVLLNSHVDIIDCRVFGQTHPLMGEIVCAEVMLAENTLFNSEGLIQFCREQLSTYKVPQRLIQVSNIDRTLSGKVKRG